jgi:hypothetical protein
MNAAEQTSRRSWHDRPIGERDLGEISTCQKKKQHSEISNSRAYFQMRCVAFNPGLQGRHDEKMYCLITAKLTFHALKPEGLQCKNR